jgi:hypothetical protein
VLGGRGGAGGGPLGKTGEANSFILEQSGAGPPVLTLDRRGRVESASFGRSSSDKIRFFSLVPWDFFLEGR